MSDEARIRAKEPDITGQFAGMNDRMPIHQVQYAFETEQREQAFLRAQFPTEEEFARYKWYRTEWHRRAKEFDPGPAPLAVTIELCSSCNLACGFCYTITQEFKNTITGAQRMLPWPIVRGIIDEAAELGVCSILFSWRGESSLYKGHDEAGNVIRFHDVLAYARKKGILEITSLTHGQLIDEEMARGLVEAEPSWISISLDGVYEAYNKIRTPPSKQDDPSYDAFQVVVDNIKRLVRLRDEAGKTRPQIRTNTVYPAIAKDPDGYRRFLLDAGVNMVTVNELLDLRDGDIPLEMMQEDWACQYPFQRLTVSANGIMLPCTGAHKEQSGLVLGRFQGTEKKQVRNVDGSIADVSLPEHSLKSAWHSEKLENIRMLHRDNRRLEIDPGCRHCNHGVKKFGADRLPDEWDLDVQSWTGRQRRG